MINDLSKDNEVLELSQKDLKFAFTFLQREHKKLQQTLVKKDQTIELLKEYAPRLQELKMERDTALMELQQMETKLK